MAFEDMKEHGTEAGARILASPCAAAGLLPACRGPCAHPGVRLLAHSTCLSIAMESITSPGSTLHALLLQRSRPSPPACRSLPRALLGSTLHALPSLCFPLAAVKAAGKWRQEGKTYEVQDGDIIHWCAALPGSFCICCMAVEVSRVCKTYEVQDGDIIHWCAACTEAVCTEPLGVCGGRCCGPLLKRAMSGTTACTQCVES